MNAMDVLKVGIPKGSLHDATVRLFEKAGYQAFISSRSYNITFDDNDLEGMLLRPQEMALYVEKGVLDFGLAGKDWVVECGADVRTVAELVYSRATNCSARWVLAVPEESDIWSVRDLQGKLIYTELVRVTEQWLTERGVQAEVCFSHGVTEAKTPYLCDAIVELTETGDSLRASKLRIVDEIMETSTLLVANHVSWEAPWKRKKIGNIAMLLRGALDAESKVGLKMNVPTSCLDEVLLVLPAMKRPTISPLTDPDWVALETVVDTWRVRDLIPILMGIGAQDVIEYALNKVLL
ncbi:MAG: ATP phosphoribosyltransferase [Nanoarchaeota archaeon]|nr:ATP phosphoribosyltransferase [Nanoarchaeota archaeon]